MQRLFILLASAVLLLYPVAVYFGLQYFEPRMLGLLLLCALVLRFSLLVKSIQLNQLKPLVGISIASALIGLLIVFFNEPFYVRLNPVVINLSLFVLFSYTLYKPPSMIERFARLQSPELPVEAISYTRSVTKIWCVFFVFNLCVSSYTTLYSSLEIWTLYNGFIAYILMGCIFVIEYIVRTIKIKTSS